MSGEEECSGGEEMVLVPKTPLKYPESHLLIHMLTALFQQTLYQNRFEKNCTADQNNMCEGQLQYKITCKHPKEEVNCV